MNHVALMGFLARDIELRYTQGGKAIGNSAIAVNRKWKNESGELKEEVSFIDLTFFGSQAETGAQYLKKGSPVIVEGRLKQETWEDKQSGAKRSKVVVIVEKLTFVPRAKEQGADSDAPTPSQAPQARRVSKVDADAVADGFPQSGEDDVPF